MRQWLCDGDIQSGEKKDIRFLGTHWKFERVVAWLPRGFLRAASFLLLIASVAAACGGGGVQQGARQAGKAANYSRLAKVYGSSADDLERALGRIRVPGYTADDVVAGAARSASRIQTTENMIDNAVSAFRQVDQETNGEVRKVIVGTVCDAVNEYLANGLDFPSPEQIQSFLEQRVVSRLVPNGSPSYALRQRIDGIMQNIEDATQAGTFYPMTVKIALCDLTR